MEHTTRWLRVEGLALTIALVATYAAIDASWWLFALLFLAPDLAMIGYLAGPRTGAITYNLAHLYAWPALLVGLGTLAGLPWALAPGLIWGAHLAFDRALGYGLKEPDAFRHTHLGLIGRGPPRTG